VVAQIIRVRLRGLVVLAVLVSAVVIRPAAGQARPSPGPRGRKRMALAAEKTFREGVHGKLPPHISTLLGISRETECPVMQNAVRTGKVVQGFDVSVANQKDIVLFVVDEAAKDQTLYLTSPAGTLRKVVAVKAGVGDVARITDNDRAAFAKEKQFWLDRLAPVSASK
jgi:hypothetical protein